MSYQGIDYTFRNTFNNLISNQNKNKRIENEEELERTRR